MLSTVTVWAECAGVFNSVLSAVCQSLLVVHFKVVRAIRFSNKRCRLTAQLTSAIGSYEHLCDDILVSKIGEGVHLHSLWQAPSLS